MTDPAHEAAHEAHLAARGPRARRAAATRRRDSALVAAGRAAMAAGYTPDDVAAMFAAHERSPFGPIRAGLIAPGPAGLLSILDAPR